MFLSFPRACLARAKNPEFRWRTWGRPGFFARQPRARMTEQEIEQDRNCHYDLQSSIVELHRVAGEQTASDHERLNLVGTLDDHHQGRTGAIVANGGLRNTHTPAE